MLEIEDLLVFYENALAINNISLRCRQGAITGLFGANSAGKSTLMYTISGILLDMERKEKMRGGERITALGRLHYGGASIVGLKAPQRARRGIILCPERRRVFSESSVLENLKIGAHLATRSQEKRTLEFVFTVFPALHPLRHRQAGFLSGGEQQQLAIGRALMAQPRLLLLDEPLLGLSPQVEGQLSRVIKQINRETAITIFIAEQYARPIIPIIDYGYVMENGSVVLEGSAAALMANPDVKAAYFGA